MTTMKQRFGYLKTLLPFMVLVAVPVAVVGAVVVHAVAPKWKGLLRRRR